MDSRNRERSARTLHAVTFINPTRLHQSRPAGLLPRRLRPQAKALITYPMCILPSQLPREQRRRPRLDALRMKIPSFHQPPPRLAPPSQKASATSLLCTPRRLSAHVDVTRCATPCEIECVFHDTVAAPCVKTDCWIANSSGRLAFKLPRKPGMGRTRPEAAFTLKSG